MSADGGGLAAVPTSGDPGRPAGRGEDADPDARLSAEDRKLVVLARGARGRAGAAEGAAVRDGDGRTYAAATVSLPSLALTAVQAAVAAAVASGAQELEAVVVIGAGSGPDAPSLAAARDLGAPVMHLADTDGTVRSTVTP